MADPFLQKIHPPLLLEKVERGVVSKETRCLEEEKETVYTGKERQKEPHYRLLILQDSTREMGALLVPLHRSGWRRRAGKLPGRGKLPLSNFSAYLGVICEEDWVGGGGGSWTSSLVREASHPTLHHH